MPRVGLASAVANVAYTLACPLRSGLATARIEFATVRIVQWRAAPRLAELFTEL